MCLCTFLGDDTQDLIFERTFFLKPAAMSATIIGKVSASQYVDNIRAASGLVMDLGRAKGFITPRQPAAQGLVVTIQISAYL